MQLPQAHLKRDKVQAACLDGVLGLEHQGARV